MAMGVLAAFMIYIGVDTGRVLPFIAAGGCAVVAAGLIIMTLKHPDA